MSKLDELITELCPDGVEYVNLKDVCTFNRGSSLTSKNAVDGIVPVISGGQKPAFYHNEANRPANTITVAGSGAYAGYVSIWDVPIFCADSFSVDIIDENILNKRYLYHYLLNNQRLIYSKKTGAGIPHVHGKDIAKLQIPLPDLLIQREIVHILDSFTLLTAELTAELTARRQQYEFYRDYLLNFEDNSYSLADDIEKTSSSVTYKSLGDICRLSAGGDVPKGHFSKVKTEKYSVPIYSNGVGANALYGYTDTPKINEECVTIAARGTIGYCELRREPFYPIIRLICAVPDETVLASFLHYVIQTITFKIPTTGIPQLTVPMIKSYLIPVPPIETQEKIVSILDRFDKLANDMSEGLPAEIEARKQQYEYYRDVLLSFDEERRSQLIKVERERERES